MNMNVAQRLILGEQTISHVQSNDKLTAWMAGGIQKQLTWKETPVWGGIWWFIFRHVHWSSSKKTNWSRWSTKSSPRPDYLNHLSYVFQLCLRWLHGTYPCVSVITLTSCGFYTLLSGFSSSRKLKHIQFTNVLIDNSSCIHGIMLGSSITNIKNTCGTITHAIMQYTLQLLSSLNDLLWIFQLTELRMLRLVLAELNATADHNAKRQERKRRITKTLHTHTFIAMFELLNLPHHLFF